MPARVEWQAALLLQQGHSHQVGVQGNQRRCLTNRAAAAAAAGHSGAQIAILKQAAVGARISVWWPLDEHWYRCACGRLYGWGRGGVAVLGNRSESCDDGGATGELLGWMGRESLF